MQRSNSAHFAKTMTRNRKEVNTDTYTGRFAVRLKTLREKAGLSVEEAADSLNVSIEMIYLYEKGTYQPRVSSFPKIADIYKVKRIRDILPAE